MEFGWVVFQRIGSDARLRDMYKAYLFFNTIIKTDIMFGIMSVLLVGLFLLARDDPELTADGILLLITFVWMFGGRRAIRNEKRLVMWIFWWFGTLEPAYIIYKIAVFNVQFEKYQNVPRRTLTAVGALALGVRALVYYSSFRCRANYGKGLRDHLNPSSKYERKLVEYV